MKILFLDIETVGLDPNVNSIIQVAAKFYDSEDSNPNLEFNSKGFNPTTRVDLGALNVNKKTFKDLLTLGKEKNEQQMLCEFSDFCLGLSRDTIICGHNVNFDINFLKVRMTINSIEGLDRLFSYRVLDTATIGHFLQSTGTIKTDKIGLSSLAKVLGVTIEENSLHEALYDVNLTAKVFFAMQDLIKKK